MKSRCLLAVIVVCWISSAAASLTAADWPTWRFDAGRTAASPEELPAALQLQWTRLMKPQKPAWPEDPRLQFDAAYEPVAAGDLLLFGSSHDDSVTAVSLSTGEQRWKFFAEGPVRFAPLIHQGSVYFGADDGALYCVELKSGSLKWRFVAEPDMRKVIGSERVISVWPVRGGPVLVDGRIHFTVGVWPFEGTFLYSVNPANGAVVQEAGAGHAAIDHDVVTLNDLTPQGYLAATDSTLFIPQGRSNVATVNRETGAFGSFSYGTHGVTNYHVAASGHWLFHGAVTYDTAKKFQISSTTQSPVIGDGTLYAAEEANVAAFDLENIKLVEKTDRRGKKTKVSVLNQLWVLPFHEVKGISAADAAAQLKTNPLVVDLRAGSRLYGHQGDFVFALDLKGSSAPTVGWQTTVDGNVASMIAANGRLVVTTIDGHMHCFGAGSGEPQTHDVRGSGILTTNSDWSDRVARLLEEQKLDDAYCVVLGAGSGGLIDALLSQSRLRLVVVDSDVQKIDALRKRLDAAHVYGSRVAACVGNPLDFELPPYMASLVVSETPRDFGLDSNPGAIAQLFRILRPYGGTAWLPGDSTQREALEKAVSSAKLASAELAHAADHSLLTRVGSLPGSADWTHEYGDASNTLMSQDALVKAPLGVLWFGGPAADGSLFYNRHFWGPSMAVIGGRMFLQGPGKMTAVDVYTGRILWQLPLEGEANYLPGRRGNDFEGALAGYHFLAVEDAL